MIDATCAPSDIRYPTDLSLLNEAREKTEEIIDSLHESVKEKTKKVRTYRKKARKEYLKVIKKRKAKGKEIRKGIKKQLQYLKRNLNHIKELSEKAALSVLSKKQYRNLLVITELYRQQHEMYETGVHKTVDRIVSISQPHVRPIIRGKARADVEFGAKISISLVDGYTFLEKLSWSPYNEGVDLPEQIERYRQRFGYYPESVQVDRIYRSRTNRRYCKDREIRMSGPPLGRPPADKEELHELMKNSRVDEVARIPVEGKIGNGKRKYGLALIKEKLAETNKTSIAINILVMNLDSLIRRLIAPIVTFVQDVRQKCLS